MSFRNMSILAACWFLLAIIQLLASLAMPAAAIAAAVGVGLLCYAAFSAFHIEIEHAWAPVWVASGASLAAILIRYMGKPGTAHWTLWLSPLVAAATVMMILQVRSSGSRRCGLCDRRLGRSPAFDCPRCGLLVCDQTCWIFEHCRCRLCEENRVPIFPPDGRWWDKRFGPRMNQGRCQLCLAEAAGADLRACAKCGRPQCRACWDAANGQCSRCQWIVHDLPPQLEVYMLPNERPGAAGTMIRRGRT